jgi:SAM-dependent methyltransferase
VIAVDVSESHLELARDRLQELGVENVRCVLLQDFDLFRDIGDFDVFYSQIVLQHNPPPVIDVLLDRALQHLASGGLGYFQVPTYHEGYSFRLEEYLKGDFEQHGIEMHALPQRRIFELARRHGAAVLEVLEDGCTGMRPGELSNTFLLHKRMTPEVMQVRRDGPTSMWPRRTCRYHLRSCHGPGARTPPPPGTAVTPPARAPSPPAFARRSR